jgi:hypothetical protein
VPVSHREKDQIEACGMCGRERPTYQRECIIVPYSSYSVHAHWLTILFPPCAVNHKHHLRLIMFHSRMRIRRLVFPRQATACLVRSRAAFPAVLIMLDRLHTPSRLARRTWIRHVSLCVMPIATDTFKAPLAGSKLPLHYARAVWLRVSVSVQTQTSRTLFFASTAHDGPRCSGTKRLDT